MDSDEKLEKPNESREGAGEVHKKRGKPLRKEPAPINDGNTIKDPTEEINWGDVAATSLRGADVEFRGELYYIYH